VRIKKRGDWKEQGKLGSNSREKKVKRGLDFGERTRMRLEHGSLPDLANSRKKKKGKTKDHLSRKTHHHIGGGKRQSLRSAEKERFWGG